MTRGTTWRPKEVERIKMADWMNLRPKAIPDLIATKNK